MNNLESEGLIEFDAIIDDMTLEELRKLMNTFQSFYLRYSDGLYDGWDVFANQDRALSWQAIDSRKLGEIEAVAFRSRSKIIVSVTTTSEEFAHTFDIWLKNYCDAWVIYDGPRLTSAPLKKIGRPTLLCNKWAGLQVLILNRTPEEIFEEWKRRYQKETGDDPNEVLANPLHSLRQAISAIGKKRKIS